MTYHKEEYTLHNGQKIYVQYNDHNICQVTKECIEMLLDLYQQGRADVVNKLLSICGSFPNNNDCIECSFAIWKDNEWNGCSIEQLKEKK